MKRFKQERVIVLLLSFFITSMSFVAAQNTTVTSRFANPQVEEASASYCVDVEIQADLAGYRFYGMNVRFFYDPSLLDFVGFDDFQEGIIAGSPNPARLTSGAQWGDFLFNLESGATSVNGAVQITNAQNALQIPTNEWAKIFSVCFEIKEEVPVDEEFCPSLIWDIKPGGDKTSFLPGSSGVVITAFTDMTNVKQKTVLTDAEHFNWSPYEEETTPPYGVPLSYSCVSLNGAVTGTSDPGSKEFALFQNTPNPFEKGTRIDFILPEASTAKLTFFDARGHLVKQIEGDYAQGRNTVVLDKKDFAVTANVYLYRLETPTHKSVYRKMVLIR